MRICKACGKKYSIWHALNTFGSGLCWSCGIKQRIPPSNADEQAASQRIRAAAEKADSKRIIDLILKAITDEQPLAYTFVNRNITKTTVKGNRLFMQLAGGALFGKVGFIIGNGLGTADSLEYSGELGMLVVTQTRIFVGHIVSPFGSWVGRIYYGHLKLFESQLSANKVTFKTFSIRQTRLPPISSDVNLLELDGYSCRTSILYLTSLADAMQDDVYEQSSAKDIRSLIERLQQSD
jgi:purine-nucleoside phosphorylase